MEIDALVKKLYESRPTKVLYHYTSLGGLQGIVASKSIRASDIRYLNDAAEMRHAAKLITREVEQRLERSQEDNKVLRQLRDWLSHRLVEGHILFAASFTESGNLLSQWRGYCPPGKGVSVGFNPDYLAKCAQDESFEIGKCIYDTSRQREIATTIVDSIQALAEKRGENKDPSKRHPTQSFYEVFELCEDHLLRVAALLKHPSFQEEQEWRIVSPVVKNYRDTPIRYREGISMLVPYIELSLTMPNGAIEFQHIYLGPTPNVNLSMNSLSNYLSRSHISPREGIRYSQIPYRQW